MAVNETRMPGEMNNNGQALSLCVDDQDDQDDDDDDFNLIDGIFEGADSSRHVLWDDPVEGAGERGDYDYDDKDDNDDGEGDNVDEQMIILFLRHEHIFSGEVFRFCAELTDNPGDENIALLLSCHGDITMQMMAVHLLLHRRLER